MGTIMQDPEVNDVHDVPLLTGEVARLLRVSAETVRRWHETGRLRARTTIGGVRLFDRNEIERLATEREKVTRT